MRISPCQCIDESESAEAYRRPFVIDRAAKVHRAAGPKTREETVVYTEIENSAVGIVGTGSCVPDRVVANSVVAAAAGVTEEWILAKTGIRSRRWAGPGEATSDLAIAAAVAAIESAGIDAAEIGWIIVATVTGDRPQPATACRVQDRIGAVQAAAFDLSSACAGFVTGLSVAARLIGHRSPSNPAYALVIGADVFSRVVDPAERRTAVLFGDGAGAVVLGPVPPGRGLVAADITSHGEYFDMIRVDAGGSRMPATAGTVEQGLHSLNMDGRATRDFVLRAVPVTVARLLDSAGIAADEIDHVIPHQANGVLLAQLLTQLKLPRARAHRTVGELGNTGAASIPITLDRCRRFGCFADGDLLLLTGFGSGMSIGDVVIRWQATGSSPVARDAQDETTARCQG